MLIKTKQQQALDKEEVGGKASNLNFLHRNGFLIPDSLIVPVSVFEDHVREIDVFESIKELSVVKSQNQLKKKGKEIRLKISKSKINKEVLNKIIQAVYKEDFNCLAVRSSVNAEDGKKFSFAGQFDSFLDVPVEEIENRVIQCWASCFSNRVIIYCFYNKIPLSKLRPAVILQEMVSAELGGVIFTKSLNPKMMLIEVCSGNVADLTDGVVKPKRFFIDRELHQREKILYDRDLSFLRIGELAKKSLNIEKLFNYPQDIEWIQQGGLVIFLQSRSIT